VSVAIVGTGATTAVGLDARQTGFLLRAGYPAMAEAPLCDASGEPITMAFVSTLDGALVGPERLAALARASFEEVVAPLGSARVEVRVALDEGCLDAALATHLVTAMIKRVLPSAASVHVEPAGEAAAASWISAAIPALETRRVDAVVIGGVHSDYDPRAIAALEAGGRLFSRDNLDSLMPGEAAAFFVLTRTGDAARYGLAPLAHVVGVGTGKERARPDNDASAHEALGLTAAVRKASEPLASTGRTAGWLLTDLTFEMRRQYEWQSVWVRAQKVLGVPYLIDAPAQRIGYLGAAAMPLFACMAATAWKHGYAPSPIALAVAGSDGGDRAAVVFEEARVDRRREA
jgi:3-oxoacyl-[acyl-carrier-protein] synthase-1